MRRTYLLSPEAAMQFFEGDRLRRARLANGWTQKRLANEIGVSRAAVAQYEGGHARPQPEVLVSMCEGLGFPLGYFTAGRPSSPLDDTDWHFRSLAATTKRERNRASVLASHVWELAAYLERYVRLPEIRLPTVGVSESSRRGVVDRAAQEARAVLGVPEGPVSDVVRYLEVNGTIVSRLGVATRDVDAFSAVIYSRPVVVLARDKNDKARSRFDAAHELGHMIMHTTSSEDSTTRLRERQANDFAAEFLMPADEILESLPAKPDFAAFLRLKHIWGVSMGALLFRARELGRMTDATYRRAVTRMSSLGWRIEEPGDLGRAEEPELLRAATRLIEAEGVTLDQISGETALPRSFLAELLSEPRDHHIADETQAHQGLGATLGPERQPGNFATSAGIPATDA